MTRGEVKNHVSISRSLYVLVLLEPRFALQVVNADAKPRRRAFCDEPGLPLPCDQKTIARGEATLPDGDRDVVRRVDEQVVLAELLQQRAKQDGLVAAIRLARHQDFIRSFQQLEIVSRLALVVLDLARDEIEYTLHARLARTFGVRR